MRFTDNAAITTDNMATDDILAGTDVSASADKKFSLANLANWFLNKFTGLSLAGSQQTVKSALDSLNSNLMHLDLGVAIPNGADLDSYTTVGTYYCGSASIAASLSHCPISTVGFKMTITQTGYADNYFIQNIKVHNRTDGERIFARCLTSNNPVKWSDWFMQPIRTEMDAIQTNPFPIKRTLTSADDLNNIIESGTYGVESSIPSNVPSDATGSYGMLMVFGGTSGTQIRCFQLYAYTGRALYYRRKFGSASDAWSAWTKVTGTVVS